METGFGPEPIGGGALNWTNWLAGVVAVYATLFDIGRILFVDTAEGVSFLLAAGVAFASIARTLGVADPAREAGSAAPETSISSVR